MKLQNNSYNILIVDSSLMIVQRLNNLLTEMEAGNCVSSANSYTEAIDKLSAEKFDIVLLDTHLQGKNSFELLSFIKMNHPGIKTIIVTNQTSDFYKSKVKRIGADYFVDKSGEFEKVTEIIKDFSLGYQMH